jgi:hypothetical protein
MYESQPRYGQRRAEQRRRQAQGCQSGSGAGTDRNARTGIFENLSLFMDAHPPTAL